MTKVWIADQEDAQRLNREVALVSLLAELGHADLQVRRSVRTEGVVRVVLQHAGLRGQAARAVDARLGPLLVFKYYNNSRFWLSLRFTIPLSGVQPHIKQNLSHL